MIQPLSYDEVASRDRRQVLSLLEDLPADSAVIVPAPPGAGKSSLVRSLARTLAGRDKALRLPVVTQTNAQADDLVLQLHAEAPRLPVARLHGNGALSARVAAASNASRGRLTVDTSAQRLVADGARVLVAPAAKWAHEAATVDPFPWMLVDESYQMDGKMLRHVGGLACRAVYIGDPGQLSPFTTLDTDRWQGLSHNPTRAAMAILTANHPDLPTHRMSVSWRLVPSAAPLIADCFYPDVPFTAGTSPADRSLTLADRRFRPATGPVDVDGALNLAASTGWAYLELPERHTARADQDTADTLARLVGAVVRRQGTVVSELPHERNGRRLEPGDIAVVTAHTDQANAVLVALEDAELPAGAVTVSTANRIQGREFALTLVWHPLAGRINASAFHLEAGRMCVMLSRHRHGCVVVGRAGAEQILLEHPDSDPVMIGEPEPHVDGREANWRVLQHLAGHRVIGS